MRELIEQRPPSLTKLRFVVARLQIFFGRFQALAHRILYQCVIWQDTFRRGDP